MRHRKRLAAILAAAAMATGGWAASAAAATPNFFRAPHTAAVSGWVPYAPLAAFPYHGVTPAGMPYHG